MINNEQYDNMGLSKQRDIYIQSIALYFKGEKGCVFNHQF